MLVVSFLACAALSTFGATQEERAPVPDEATRDRLTKELRELFKDDYAKTRPADRGALAQRFLADAPTTNDPSQRFVMLVEAADLAAKGGSHETSMRAIELLDAQFTLRRAGPGWSPTALKVAALDTARPAAKSREAASAVAQAYLATAKQGLTEGDFKSALAAARAVSSLAGPLHSKSLLDESKELTRNLTALEKEFRGLQEAELALSIDPADPEANLVVGRFYCLVADDWKKGLPCLVRCKDPALKAVAGKELAGPRDATGRIEIADGWFDLAKAERKPFSKERYQERAREWYERGLVDADGFTRLKINKRLGELPVRSIDLLKKIDPTRDAVTGTWSFTNGALVSPDNLEYARIKIPHPFPDEYDLELVITRLTGKGGGAIGLVGGGRQFAVNVDARYGKTWGLDLIDGKPHWENGTKVDIKIFEIGKPKKVLCSVRKDSVTVSVDGRTVIKWKADYGRVTLPPQWAMPDKRVGFVGSWNSTFRYSRIRLVPVSGQGSSDR